MLKNTLAFLLLIPVALTMTSCGVAVKSRDAENAVATFHNRLNAGDLDAIWNEAHPTFRKDTERADFDRLMEMVRTKLGKMTSGNNNSFKMKSGTGGSSATVGRDSKFEHGTARETFHFRSDGGEMRLYHYDIRSDVLAPK